jgi:hypothetical protein
LSSVNVRPDQVVRPKADNELLPLSGRRERADSSTPRYEKLELGEREEELAHSRGLWARFWRLKRRRRVTFADDNDDAATRMDRTFNLETINELPLSVLAEDSGGAKVFKRYLEQLDLALRHNELDVWQVRSEIECKSGTHSFCFITH